MDSCCDNKADELAQLRAKQGRVLYIVLAINGAMFLVEFAAGWIVGSTALLGDSLDMLSDALVYIVSLYVLHRGVRARAGAALFKSGFMMLFSVLIIGEAIRKSLLGAVPEGDWMALIGLVALAANLTCLGLLYRHRSDDINMSSTWICSRNDVIANLSVLAAAALVMLTGTLWPDVIVGVGLALLYLHSSWQVARAAWPQWREHSPSKTQQKLVERAMQMPASAPACCGVDTGTQAEGCHAPEAPLQEASCCGASAKQRCNDTSDTAAADDCCGDKAVNVEPPRKALSGNRLL